MAVAVPQQNTNVASTVLVEEKFYEIDLAENERALRAAVEQAAGMPMDELAPGMWFGSRSVGRWTTIEVTARAQAVDDGTTLELRVEHKVNPLATTFLVGTVIVGSLFIVPLVAIIAWGQKTQQEQGRQRLILLHKIWRGVAESVEAPKRGGYRESPKRVYVPAPAEPVRVATDAAAESEAAGADERELRERS